MVHLVTSPLHSATPSSSSRFKYIYIYILYTLLQPHQTFTYTSWYPIISPYAFILILTSPLPLRQPRVEWPRVSATLPNFRTSPQTQTKRVLQTYFLPTVLYHYSAASTDLASIPIASGDPLFIKPSAPITTAYFPHLTLPHNQTQPHLQQSTQRQCLKLSSEISMLPSILPTIM